MFFIADNPNITGKIQTITIIDSDYQQMQMRPDFKMIKIPRRRETNSGILVLNAAARNTDQTNASNNILFILFLLRLFARRVHARLYSNFCCSLVARLTASIIDTGKNNEISEVQPHHTGDLSGSQSDGVGGGRQRSVRGHGLCSRQ